MGELLERLAGVCERLLEGAATDDNRALARAVIDQLRGRP